MTEEEKKKHMTNSLIGWGILGAAWYFVKNPIVRGAVLSIAAVNIGNTIPYINGKDFDGK